MKLFALALVACLSMGACATDGVAPDITVIHQAPPVPSGSTAISAVAQKALYAAEAAYNIPAQAYVTLNRKGSLTPELKAKAKPLLLQAYHGLELARQAAAAGDTIGVMTQAGEAQRLAAAVTSMLPK